MGDNSKAVAYLAHTVFISSVRRCDNKEFYARFSMFIPMKVAIDSGRTRGLLIACHEDCAVQKCMLLLNSLDKDPNTFQIFSSE